MAAPPAQSPPSARDVRAGRPALDRRVLGSRARRVLSALILALLDVAGVLLAYYLALATKQVYLGLDPFPDLIYRAVAQYAPFVALVVILVFARAGLYRSREQRPGTQAVISALALTTVVLLLLALAKGDRFHTYTSFFVAFVYAAVLCSLLRASYDSITLTLMRLAHVERRTLLAGRAADLEGVAGQVAHSSRGPGVRVIGVVTDDPGEAHAGGPRLGRLADLARVVAEERPDDLVLAGVELPDSELLELVERCRDLGTRLRLVPTTTELLSQRATFVPGQSMPLFEIRPPVLTGLDWALKRSFDVVVSLVLLVLLAPLLLLLAVLIRLTSPGPVVYRDPRIGVGEREFAMLKFRSMYRDAAERQAELERHNEADGAIFKMRDDPRVTPVGRVIRRLSLDELLQLVNVLRGEMSLVGPRPLPLRDYQLLAPWHRRRYRVLPGITGLWQVSGRSTLSFDDLVRLDFYYLENWSIWLDVAILLRTPVAVARGRGAY